MQVCYFAKTESGSIICSIMEVKFQLLIRMYFEMNLIWESINLLRNCYRQLYLTFWNKENEIFMLLTFNYCYLLAVIQRRIRTEILVVVRWRRSRRSWQYRRRAADRILWWPRPKRHNNHRETELWPRRGTHRQLCWSHHCNHKLPFHWRWKLNGNALFTLAHFLHIFCVDRVHFNVIHM